MRKYFVIPISVLFPLLILCLYFFYNEANSGWSMQCTFYQFTGLHCPGCGGQRALHHLLHGEFLKAFRSNILFVIFTPFFVYLYVVLVEVYGLNKQKHLDNFWFSGNFGWIVLLITLSFFILRNIPCIPFSYLSPP